jgi:hypothetical protein
MICGIDPLSLTESIRENKHMTGDSLPEDVEG